MLHFINSTIRKRASPLLLPTNAEGQKGKKSPQTPHYVFTTSRAGFKLVLTEGSLPELGASAQLLVTSHRGAAEPGCQQKTD